MVIINNTLTNDEKNKLNIGQEYRGLLAGLNNENSVVVVRRLSEIEVALGEAVNEMFADILKNYTDQY